LGTILLFYFFIPNTFSQHSFPVLPKDLEGVSIAPTTEVLFYAYPTTYTTNQSFIKGIICTSTKKIFEIEVHFDITKNQLFIQLDKVIYSMHPDKVNYAYWGDDLIIYTDYLKKGEFYQNYMKVLVNGNTSLLVHQEENKKKIEKYYYIKEFNAPAVSATLSKKTLLDITIHQNKSIKAYINQHKLNPREETDFSILLTYYNALQQQ